jgi:geranylgeranyl reductase family protein
MLYDVIVVGAGPAGSTAARECALLGSSVLLLDKAEFPRDKPCGGGVTVRAANLLPFEISPVVERVITGLRITTRQSNEFGRTFAGPLAYMTLRSRLDQFLVDRAIDAGVVTRLGVGVKEVERLPNGVAVHTDDGRIQGRTMVIADGANGQVSNLAGIEVRPLHHVALEANISPPDGVTEPWQDSVGVDIGGIRGGYGWIFPKGDHLNIGIGGWRYVGPGLRDALHGLVNFCGFDQKDLWGIRGYNLLIRRQGSPLSDGNIVLVGDAAGLIDPMTDAGIHSAIFSGKVAAKHISEYVAGEVPDLDGYRRQIESDLVPQLRVSRQFHDLFHLTPALHIAIERRTSILWSVTCRIIRGEQTYPGVMRRHKNLGTVVEFVSDLIRVTPLLRRMSGLRDPAPTQRFFLRGQHR